MGNKKYCFFKPTDYIKFPGTLHVLETGRQPTMTRAWVMFQVSVVMLLLSGSTIESSMIKAFCAM